MSLELTQAQKKALQILKEQGGVIRTSEALRAGIHPRTLYSLRDRGAVENTITRSLSTC